MVKNINTHTAALTANAGSSTDRTAGNKVTPDDRITGGLPRNNEHVREAVQDVRSDIATSIKKVGDTARKVADAAKDAADGAKDAA